MRYPEKLKTDPESFRKDNAELIARVRSEEIDNLVQEILMITLL